MPAWITEEMLLPNFSKHPFSQSKRYHLRYISTMGGADNSPTCCLHWNILTSPPTFSLDLSTNVRAHAHTHTHTHIHTHTLALLINCLGRNFYWTRAPDIRTSLQLMLALGSGLLHHVRYSDGRLDNDSHWCAWEVPSPQRRIRVSYNTTGSLCLSPCGFWAQIRAVAPKLTVPCSSELINYWNHLSEGTSVTFPRS
jgi:hypothetical protein